MSFRGSNPLISPNQLIQVRVLVNPQNKFIEIKIWLSAGIIDIRYLNNSAIEIFIINLIHKSL